MGIKDGILKKRVKAEEGAELIEKTVAISRVAKVVKGGKRFGFNALVVVGDGRGRVGYALGKAGEVPDAIRKGGERARKCMIKIPVSGSTIAHDVHGSFGSCEVVLKPGSPGTGVIAGSVVRCLVEAAGIKDIRTKCIGSSNPHNLLKAVMKGFLQLREPQAVAQLRGMQLKDVGYSAY